MPGEIGKSEAAAKADLESKGFTVSTLNKVDDANIGRVLDQNPEQGHASAAEQQRRAHRRYRVVERNHDHDDDHGTHDDDRAVTSALERWYREHGRHTLPWRASRDRWSVLVSEVMLHQTQVPRVAAVFDSFMTEFPTPAAMAAAGPGAVITALGPARISAPRPLALGGGRQHQRTKVGPPTSRLSRESAATRRPRSPRRSTTTTGSASR